MRKEINMIRAWKPVGGYAMFLLGPDKKYYRTTEEVGNWVNELRQKKTTDIDLTIYDEKLKRKYQSMTGAEINELTTAIRSLEEFDKIFGTNLAKERDQYKERLKKGGNMNRVVKIGERQVEAALFSEKSKAKALAWLKKANPREDPLFGSDAEAELNEFLEETLPLVELELKDGNKAIRGSSTAYTPKGKGMMIWKAADGGIVKADLLGLLVDYAFGDPYSFEQAASLRPDYFVKQFVVKSPAGQAEFEGSASKEKTASHSADSVWNQLTVEEDTAMYEGRHPNYERIILREIPGMDADYARELGVLFDAEARDQFDDLVSLFV